MLNCQVLTEKLLRINQFTCWKWVEETKNTWFELFYWQKSFWRWYTKLFSISDRYFKVIANTDYTSSSKSEGLSAENITPPTTSDNRLAPPLIYYGTKTTVKFNGSCLKQPKLSYTHEKQ